MNNKIYELELKKAGILNIELLDDFSKNIIIKSIAEKIAPSFSEYGFNLDDITMSLSKLNMYYADFLQTTSQAKYYYKKNEIYLSKSIQSYELESCVIHECIHYLQTEVDLKGKFKRMGLFKEINFFKQEGLGLNEAAVQYISSNILNEKPSTVTYFDLSLKSPSPNIYPIETTLIRQLMFFTGSYPLFFSTLLSNDVFKETFVNITSLETYMYISEEMDNLLKYQDKLSEYYEKRSIFNLSPMATEKLNKKIEQTKLNIQNTSLNIQDVIFQNAFNNLLNNVSTKQDVINVKNQLNNFENYIIQKDGDNSYMEYKAFANALLDQKDQQIEIYGDFVIDGNEGKSNELVSNNSSGINFIKSLYNKIKMFVQVKLKLRLPDESFE